MIQIMEAQDSWTVKLNNKLLLTATKEDTLANTKKVSQLEWRKSGYLEVIYKEAEPGPWMRSFLFYDENDNQLLNKDSVTYTKIANATLRKLFAGKKKMVIYVVIAPKNPMIMIRIRRMHLCTLLLP